MKLYDRDYLDCILTEEEEINYKKAIEIESKNETKIGTFSIGTSMWNIYPKAIRHSLALFPNNYLDPLEWKEEEGKLKSILNEYTALINNKETTERNILNFIRDEKAYFIIGAILKTGFNFGHHDAYLFREFQLGLSYKTDFLIIGKGSGGYEFIFVELESVNGTSTLNNGNIGENFRKGIIQIKDWEMWLESNFSKLNENFNKVKNNNENLPNEFLSFDRSRIHYVVVAGKRKDFNEKTYRIRRDTKDKEKIILLHYENLLDNSNKLIEGTTY